MTKGTGDGETTTLATDLRRLVILALLTALAVLLCERWSEAGDITANDRSGAPIARTH